MKAYRGIAPQRIGSFSQRTTEPTDAHPPDLQFAALSSARTWTLVLRILDSHEATRLLVAPSGGPIGFLW